MGRGRKGPVDQSAKKTKISKNKIRGGNYGVISRKSKQNYPLLLSEDVIADMKKMRPQDLMNILIDDPEEQNYRSFLLSEGQDYQLIPLSEYLIEEEKKIRPHDLMNNLIDDPEISYNFPEGTREAVQSCKCPRKYFGWKEMKKMDQIELMEKLLEINKCQGCQGTQEIKKAETEMSDT